MSRKLLFTLLAFVLIAAMTSTACCGLTDLVGNAISGLGDEDTIQDEVEEPSIKPTASPSQDQPEDEEQSPAEPAQPADDPADGSPGGDTPSDPPTAPAGTPGRTMYTNANQVEDLIVQGDTLWVATLGGVVAWDLNTGESVQYTTFDGLSSNGIFAIEACPPDNPAILVGTDEGIDVFDPDTGRWSSRPALLGEDAPDGGDTTPLDYFRSADEVSALHCDAENNRLFIDYWSIRIVDLDTGDITELTEDDGLPHNGFSQIAISGEDIWVATGWGGITRITNGTDITVFDEESGDLPTDYVDFISIDQDGGVWGASSDGMHHYANGTWTHYTEEDVDGFGFYVYDMAMAPDGTLWVAFSTEVCRFDIASTSCTEVIELGEEDGQVDGWLSTVLVDYNGRFFYGTDDDGISMFDDNGWTMLALENQPLADNVVTSALEDSQGNIWIGTSDGGATRFSADGVSQETYTHLDSDINSSYVQDMAEGPNGIWFLHSYSVSHYDGSEWAIYEEEDGVREQGGDVIAVDDAGQLWIGGDEGLTIFDGDTFISVGVDEGWPEKADIYAFLPDGDIMWAGTNVGLFSFSGSDFKHVLTEESPGLEDDYITGVAKMADGNLLLAHGYGLAVYEPGGNVNELEGGSSWVNDVLALPDGDIWLAGSGLYHYDGSTWETMTTFDGLPHMDMRAILVDRQGALWAGGGSSGQGGGLVRITDMGQAGGPPPQPPASADAGGAAAPQTAGETTRQWASSATASSQYGSANWGPDQATGEPNTEGCGDFGTAWASSGRSTVEWLELDYDTPVTPTEVHIYQNYNPNQVTQVELIDTNGVAHVIYETPTQKMDCPYTLTIPVEGADYQAATIRITVDQSLLSSWNEIDAVELIGY
jgi:ligand-binding sensor domain-containing protein